MADHARLAPSAASRWMACSGSVALGEKAQALLGPEQQSDPAALGTALHEAAEQMLIDPDLTPKDLVGREYNGWEIKEEHLDRFIPYVELVKSLGGDQFYEVQVIVDDELCWGTADAIVFYEKKGIMRMAVIDLKTGSGVKVHPYENYQLLIYAIGAFEAYDFLYEPKYIDMVIVQPTFYEKPQVWTLDNLELEDYHKEVLAAMARVAEFPNTYTPGESQCRWCRGRALCPALEAEMRRAMEIDHEAMTGENMAEALSLVPLVKTWIDGVENFSKDFMLEGHTVPGYKVVHGRRSRRWTAEDAVIRFLKNRIPKFKTNCYTPQKLKSPAQIETAIRKLNLELDISDLITTSEGNPTIAKESDSRDAIEPGNRAAEDFAGVGDD